MKYEICVRPFDGTPEGDLPKCYIKEYDSDKDALAAAAAMEYDTGKVDPAQKYDIMMICPLRSIGVVLLHQSASEGFVFYVKNITKDTMLYKNPCEDPEDWKRAYENDYEEEEDWDDEEDDDLITASAVRFAPWQ